MLRIPETLPHDPVLALARKVGGRLVEGRWKVTYRNQKVELTSPDAMPDASRL